MHTKSQEGHIMSNKFDENKSVSDDTIEIDEILLDMSEKDDDYDAKEVLGGKVNKDSKVKNCRHHHSGP